jgi:hypothetical protein
MAWSAPAEVDRVVSPQARTVSNRRVEHVADDQPVGRCDGSASAPSHLRNRSSGDQGPCNWWLGRTAGRVLRAGGVAAPDDRNASGLALVGSDRNGDL